MLIPVFHEYTNNLNQKNFLYSQIKDFQQKLDELDAKLFFHSIDSYEPKYDFIRSSDYIIELKNIELAQREMRKKHKAFIFDAELFLESKKREGQKMTKVLVDRR